ncbi:zinc-alpha-2-glycoprotein [Bombina bombina]|uniref:zinc-alpha-2-glycoprotein n=1 Tax=Bombina bombina TaxID=8345 RepID=UPI00235B25CC|nr:zinc-alpha-2-glycoprotein [Bombina bombina]
MASIALILEQLSTRLDQHLTSCIDALHDGAVLLSQDVHDLSRDVLATWGDAVGPRYGFRAEDIQNYQHTQGRRSESVTAQTEEEVDLAKLSHTARIVKALVSTEEALVLGDIQQPDQLNRQLSLFMPPDDDGSHYLIYQYAGITDPRSGFFEFVAFGYVDDIIIMHYHSDTREARPGTEWMKKNLGPEYWASETRIDRGHEDLYRSKLKIAMKRFNQSEGLHVYQSMYGCELREDGSTTGYTQHAYDGDDFLSLDKDRMVYVPSMDEAQITTQRWNLDRSFAERRKLYFDTECIEWLQKYVNYGKDILEGKVKPKVKVWGVTSEGVVRLHCLAYGFYPKPIDVKWTLNDQDIPIEEAKQVLPDPEGTYQVRLTVEVIPVENQIYTCHVDHSSLSEEIKVPWNPEQAAIYYKIIIGGIAGLALLSILILVFRRCRKIYGAKEANYTPTSTAELDKGNSSASSSSSV